MTCHGTAAAAAVVALCLACGHQPNAARPAVATKADVEAAETAPAVGDAAEADAATGPIDVADGAARQSPNQATIDAAIGRGGDGVAATEASASAADAQLDATATTATPPPECATATDCAALGATAACSHWTCSISGTCVAAPDPAGTACKVGAGCAQWSCGADAQCSVVAALPCPNGVCAVGACAVATGACSLQLTAIGTLCDDGNACTTGDACSSTGICVAGLPSACTAEVCQTATCDITTGACVATPVAATTTCDDGELCTAGDTCALGQCQPGTWTCACKVNGDCGDANPCTVATCQAGTCVVVALDATPCDDANACTSGDGCATGVCLPSAATSCDDGNACTADACAPATGLCAHIALEGGGCDDGNLCTLADSCAAAACKGGPPATCDDANPCTDDGCAPATGQCVHAPSPPKACGPANVCTQGLCSCALGQFAVPTIGSEFLRAVASTQDGFVAVGDSVTPSGLRGLAVAVTNANATLFVRRLGGSAATSFAGVVGDSNGVRVAVTSQTSHADVAHLDALGNITKQAMVFANAEAQALLALPDGGALLLATDLWIAGAPVRVARLSATDTVVWATALPPPDAVHTARASDMVLIATELVVAGQHHAFAAPQLTQPWLVRMAVATGQVVADVGLPALPPSAQVLAISIANDDLWLGGENTDAAGGAWLARATLDAQGMPEGVTVVAAAVGGASWRGLAAVADGVVAAGYQTQAGLDVALRRLTKAGTQWTVAAAAPGQQTLHGVAQLADGTLVAVGGRAAAVGNEALWLRVNGAGKLGCP